MSAPIDLAAIFTARMDSVILESKALAKEAVPLLRTAAGMAAKATAARLQGAPDEALERDIELIGRRITLAGAHVAARQFNAALEEALNAAASGALIALG